MSVDPGLWSSVIAVAGTLAGGLLAGRVQVRGARAERAETVCEDRRREAVAAVTALVAALADHRRAMWVLGERRLSGADASVVDAARATSHETRSAVTAPLVMVRLLAPALAAPARQAVTAAYVMRDAADLDALETVRAAALAASDHLVDQATEEFTGMAVTI